MIIRSLKTLARTKRQVNTSSGKSTRFLLAEDRMGFSLNVTEINSGEIITMRYEHHLEAVYCVSGKGSIEDLANGVLHPLAAGTLYALDQHDHHILRSSTKLKLICVFNPALKGTETRTPGGGYPRH